MKLSIDYPSIEEEHEILRRMAKTNPVEKVEAVISPADILNARAVIDEIYMDEKLEKYILDIVFATRKPEKYNMPDLSALIQTGASPRATINLTLASKAYAFIHGRGYVSPQDVKTIGPDVMRHRVTVSYEAEAEEITSDDIVKRIFDEVEVP